MVLILDQFISLLPTMDRSLSLSLHLGWWHRPPAGASVRYGRITHKKGQSKTEAAEGNIDDRTAWLLTEPTQVSVNPSAKSVQRLSWSIALELKADRQDIWIQCISRWFNFIEQLAEKPINIFYCLVLYLYVMDDDLLQLFIEALGRVRGRDGWK